MSRIGKYSGNERLDPSNFEEPDSDNEYTAKLWFEEIPKDPDFLEEVKEQVENWKKTISVTADPDSLEIHMVGQSHIDVAWRWRYEQTRKKAIITFRKAVYHARKFANSNHKFCFALSEPLLLEWVKEDDPNLFKDIQEVVEQGGIELVGGSYVEPDCMMPSGEAFIRSRLYGQRFLRDNFGRLAEVEWFLDSFGYNYGLPQILVKSGAKAFWTSKITWNRQTIFPFVNFWWEGPDGSKILTANFQMGMGSIQNWIMWEIGRHPLKKEGQKYWDYTYNYEDIADHVEEEEICPHCGCFFGKGDGGHGPTHQEVVIANTWEDLGFSKWSRVGKFFAKLREWSDRFPIWNDELYLEYHRGTFSVHSEVKKHNRYYENKLIDTEILALITALTNPKYEYPMDKLEKLWKIVLQNQFHDVLPGSSIPEVYDDVYDFWVEQDKMLSEINEEIGKGLIKVEEKSKSLLKEDLKENEVGLYLCNPVSWDRKSPIFIPIDIVKDKINVSLNNEGKPPFAKLITYYVKEESTDINDIQRMEYICQPVPAEPESIAYPRPAGWWVVPELKGISNTPAKLVILTDQELKDLANEEYVKAKATELDNGIISLKIDEKTGAILELKAKGINNEKNLLKGNQSNLTLGFLDDYPHDHAWNIKPKYWNFPLEDIKNDENVKIKIEDKGFVFSTILISRTLGKEKSKVEQKITLYKDSPIVYLEWRANWKQPFVMLKVLYETATNAEISTSDQAYCAIERKTQPETPCDKARYEKIMHKYCDLSTPDNKWGISLLNEGKYAYDTMGDRGSMRLTMLRSPRYPTPAGEAWVIKERRYNKGKYGHEVPEFSGLGPERCRYALYPHVGGALTDEKGSPNPIVKQKAEEFNQPVIPISSKNKDYILIGNKIGISGQSILKIKPSSAYLGALKFEEWNKDGNIIIRIAEACGQATEVEITINKELANKIKRIQPVDLLEKDTNREFEWNPSNSVLKFTMGKFEICSFKLIL
ncbi:MAG: alpha-mannosidase [Promethearchaeota archaeon]